VKRTNDPAVVRAEYQDEASFAAVTNSESNLNELWSLAGGGEHRAHPFSSENAGEQLERHFARVERRDADGTVTFPDWDAAYRYVENSVTRRDLAVRFPRFEGPLVCSRLVSVFGGEKAR